LKLTNPAITAVIMNTAIIMHMIMLLGISVLFEASAAKVFVHDENDRNAIVKADKRTLITLLCILSAPSIRYYNIFFLK
jgi:hypothetical protein